MNLILNFITGKKYEILQREKFFQYTLKFFSFLTISLGKLNYLLIFL